IELELDFPEAIPPWPLSRSERYHLALAAIEALNNVLKHSHATFLWMRLRLGPDSFTLQIADNGAGIAPPTPGSNQAQAGHGNGLANMRQRLERLGGRFKVSSQTGLGTTIEMWLAPSALRSGKAPSTPQSKDKS
ncbi:MAG TPA: ATP-binding protein, partial [Candidatus Dormibacteraeota bacterium]|nr:ATP-binding protein [Candidatus Dormibacteraeota bacterium]